MIDAYTAAYSSVSHATQTASLSLSLQQNKIGGDAAAPAGSSVNRSGFSLNYTATTTVTTFSQLYVQEARDSAKPHDKEGDGDSDDKKGKAALASVLAGPGDPANPLASAVPVKTTALDIIKGALQAYQSGSQDGNDDTKNEAAGKDRGNAFGHAVRDNTHGHTKNDIQAAYSVTRLQVTTTSVELSLVA